MKGEHGWRKMFLSLVSFFSVCLYRLQKMYGFTMISLTSYFNAPTNGQMYMRGKVLNNYPPTGSGIITGAVFNKKFPGNFK